jgi:hypothetical protein
LGNEKWRRRGRGKIRVVGRRRRKRRILRGDAM